MNPLLFVAPLISLASVTRGVLLSVVLLCLSLHGADRPNVLFISVDDMNDWVGVFGGNPQCQTPHIDKFSDEGAMVFQNAHCAGPVCGPSRSALLSGFMPYRTGAYSNGHNFLKSAIVQTNATLPEYFAKNGYHTVSRGKISHAHITANGRDRGQWMYDDWSNTTGSDAPDPNHIYSRRKNLADGKPLPDDRYSDPHGSEFAWGYTLAEKEGTKDYQTAQWAAEELKKDFDKPFFMAVGISNPHLAWFVPKEYFDRYPLDEVALPEVREDDLDDILTPDGKKKFGPMQDYLWVNQDEDLFKGAVRAYMAATTYADECVGVVLDALRNSEYWENTIVVIWGDHGWHLGEKMQFRKAKLWSEDTRCPIIVRLPGMTEKQDCNGLVSLIDFYPTLIELCGLPEKELDGRSFVPLLENPNRDWPYPMLTVNGYENYSIQDYRYRYTRYRDGTEELYDLKNDPMEFSNLARSEDKMLVAAKRRLADLLPNDPAPELPNNKGGKKSREIDYSIKKTRDLSRLK